MNNNNNKILSIKIEEKKFNNFKVIENLDIELYRNDKISIFAPSGSGKSTLIKIINNIDKNYKGKIDKYYSNSSVLLQEAPLFWYKNVKENIFYPYQFYKIDEKLKEILTINYNEWIEITELKNFEKYYPFELSGGMKQKVSLIRTFLFNPEIVFLDEPFTFLDIKSKSKIMEYIKYKYKSITIFMVSHNIDELPDFLDKIYLFKETKLSNYELINIKDYKSKIDLFKKILNIEN
ncbi:MAG: ATP-binding cassette domain-containing protein [Spirochaetes bacterium]|nr:ATP-binding cassette domain-containing protein [Spirochaetota bacterium]